MKYIRFLSWVFICCSSLFASFVCHAGLIVSDVNGGTIKLYWFFTSETPVFVRVIWGPNTQEFPATPTSATITPEFTPGIYTFSFYTCVAGRGGASCTPDGTSTATVLAPPTGITLPTQNLTGS
ncbi:MAG TPA: hypothetical protein PK129_18505, partial [Cellvibrionaceae bacterium]|nr:hypothetical protein [Cellvibrionaceae bacterium]